MQTLKRYNNGTALVISLILLVILTLVATSGMTTSTLELRMAGGRQASLSAFQVAENALETAVNCRLPMAGQIVREGDCPAVATAGEEHYEFTIERSPGESSVLPEGVSLGSDFEAVQFKVEAAATAGRGAKAELSQGFYVLGLKE